MAKIHCKECGETFAFSNWGEADDPNGECCGSCPPPSRTARMADGYWLDHLKRLAETKYNPPPSGALYRARTDGCHRMARASDINAS